MPPPIYPQDAVGNTIRRGDYIHLRLDHPFVLAMVTEVTAAGGLADAKGGMLLNGTLVVQAVIPINFAPDAPNVNQAYVIKTPEPQDAPKVITQ